MLEIYLFAIGNPRPHNTSDNIDYFWLMLGSNNSLFSGVSEASKFIFVGGFGKEALKMIFVGLKAGGFPRQNTLKRCFLNLSIVVAQQSVEDVVQSLRLVNFSRFAEF